MDDGSKHDTQAAQGPLATPPRFGMVIDLNRCVGCQTCTIACKQANATPPGVQWRQVHDVERGEFPNVERFFLVVGCQHCAEPPCVPVCPTGATVQRSDGLVAMDYDLCIGCGYCAVACPYQARTIVHNKKWYYGTPTAQEQKTYPDERLGVVSKCSFCVGRIDDAKARGVVPGSDIASTPACAASCIAEAISFGDFADPRSKVSKLAAANPHFQMHAELGTDPQIKYLYKAPPHAAHAEKSAPPPADEADPENPMVGRRQRFWDGRAAMNFTMGGMSSGLAIVAYAAHLAGVLPASALIWLQAVAAMGMAVGLFFVFLEIGRKLRFLYVLRRPQTSWMTRETYFVAAFYPAVLADLIWTHSVLHLIVAISAAGFLYCQSRILHAGKGIPAWRHGLMPWMLIATGLFEGLGLIVLASGWWSAIVAGPILYLCGIALALICAALWWRYTATAKRRGIGLLARKELSRVTPLLMVAGYALPLLLFVAAALDVPGAVILAGCGGVAAVIGGATWKFTIVVRASHQQGFAVPEAVKRSVRAQAQPGMEKLRAPA